MQSTSSRKKSDVEQNLQQQQSQQQSSHIIHPQTQQIPQIHRTGNLTLKLKFFLNVFI